MVSILNQDVPADLQQRLADVVNNYTPWNSTNRYAVRRADVFYPSEPVDPFRTRKTAQACAEWLADAWVPDRVGRSRADWVYARRSEILAGAFPAPYWASVPFFAEQARSYVPTCVADDARVPPNLRCAGHVASSCAIGKTHPFYPLPAPFSPYPSPSPGWRGETIDGRFRDVWVASHQRQWQLPYDPHYDWERPVWLSASVTITLSASSVGHVLWGTPCVNVDVRGSDYDLVMPFFHGYNKVPFTLESGAPYAQSVSSSFVRPALFPGVDRPGSLSPFVHADFCPFPSHGHFGQCNDWVQSWLTLDSSQVFRALGPGEV